MSPTCGIRRASATSQRDPARPSGLQNGCGSQPSRTRGGTPRTCCSGTGYRTWQRRCRGCGGPAPMLAVAPGRGLPPTCAPRRTRPPRMVLIRRMMMMMRMMMRMTPPEPRWARSPGSACGSLRTHQERAETHRTPDAGRCLVAGLGLCPRRPESESEEVESELSPSC